MEQNYQQFDRLEEGQENAPIVIPQPSIYQRYYAALDISNFNGFIATLPVSLRPPKSLQKKLLEYHNRELKQQSWSGYHIPLALSNGLKFLAIALPVCLIVTVMYYGLNGDDAWADDANKSEGGDDASKNNQIDNKEDVEAGSIVIFTLAPFLMLLIAAGIYRWIDKPQYIHNAYNQFCEFFEISRDNYTEQQSGSIYQFFAAQLQYLIVTENNITSAINLIVNQCINLTPLVDDDENDEIDFGQEINRQQLPANRFSLKLMQSLCESSLCYTSIATRAQFIAEIATTTRLNGQEKQRAMLIAAFFHQQRENEGQEIFNLLSEQQRAAVSNGLTANIMSNATIAINTRLVEAYTAAQSPLTQANIFSSWPSLQLTLPARNSGVRLEHPQDDPSASLIENTDTNTP